MPSKTIAIDLDDTLNNFSETLARTRFEYDASYGMDEDTFSRHLERLRSGAKDESELLSTQYSFLRYRIHQRCYELSRPTADGVNFMRALRSDGWRIVICTHRDLRRANACTRRWLDDNKIPFDYLFMAWNKIVFCRAWAIEHLVDDDPFNIRFGTAHGVNVYYPLTERNRGIDPSGARGFSQFDEVRRWIER
jgi:5'(3')-deoxyribonucleotidase